MKYSRLFPLIAVVIFLALGIAAVPAAVPAVLPLIPPEVLPTIIPIIKPLKLPPQLLHDDPPPSGLDKNVRVSTQANVNSIALSGVCDGDGTSGKRIQVIYVHAVDVPDQYAAYLSSFQAWAVGTDTIFNNSAAQTGGSRHIRFVHDAACTPTVLDVQVTTTGDDNFANTESELLALGFNSPNRKYLLFVDSHVYCGISDTGSDDRPTADNINNTAVSFSRVDAGCWSPAILAHELIHSLGGVQMSAPHSSGGWHCTDIYDRMCYSDFPYYPTMFLTCPDTANALMLDCNHDDYYSTNPPANSYLATHWNTANSWFLIGSPFPIPAIPTPTVCTRGNSGKPCK